MHPLEVLSARPDVPDGQPSIEGKDYNIEDGVRFVAGASRDPHPLAQAARAMSRLNTGHRLTGARPFNAVGHHTDHCLFPSFGRAHSGLWRPISRSLSAPVIARA